MRDRFRFMYFIMNLWNEIGKIAFYFVCFCVVIREWDEATLDACWRDEKICVCCIVLCSFFFRSLAQHQPASTVGEAMAVKTVWITIQCVKFTWWKCRFFLLNICALHLSVIENACIFRLYIWMHTIHLSGWSLCLPHQYSKTFQIQLNSTHMVQWRRRRREKERDSDADLHICKEQNIVRWTMRSVRLKWSRSFEWPLRGITFRSRALHTLFGRTHFNSILNVTSNKHFSLKFFLLLCIWYHEFRVTITSHPY